MCRLRDDQQQPGEDEGGEEAKSPAFQSLSGLRPTRAAVRRLRTRAAMRPTAARTPKVGRDEAARSGGYKG